MNDATIFVLAICFLAIGAALWGWYENMKQETKREAVVIIALFITALLMFGGAVLFFRLTGVGL